MISYPMAKINLGLDIVRRRPDGYHDLETVFLPLKGLTDILEIIPSKTLETTLDCYGPYRIDSDPSDNLVMKAYRLLGQEYDIPPVEIHLYKHIPSQAGMGGGSSDASYCLKALNEMFRLGISSERLQALALRLGADCPVFIPASPCYAEGVGERLEEIPLDLSGYKLLVVKPSLAVSTKEAFQGVRPQMPQRNCKDIVLREPIENWKGLLKNDFESSLYPQHPELQAIKDLLYAKGALYASLSGSGSAIYGIFPSLLKVDVSGFAPDSRTFLMDL